ncbi:hypothetical protein PpBr36_08452 [Pyricularia pennisetigena]|uniref:hypothetical protein n=1 Tax=Pyricularia pennisetigena TaxID=1578925 RepID=UPI00114E4AA7|nr:hypothetical protein PpBr36_08452 [Pyricularia pennisetigena]TLS24406.1 hypothetical protein PpBr36_08452 [Pyricularia pennisetigena]
MQGPRGLRIYTVVCLPWTLHKVELAVQGLLHIFCEQGEHGKRGAWRGSPTRQIFGHVCYYSFASIFNYVSF